jgi:hypothetical protein
MAYNAVPTVATGDSWSASQHNTYIRDNFTALWPYTTAGDLAFASASNALSRLPKVAGGLLYGGVSGPDYLALVAGGLLYGGASGPAYLSLAAGDIPYRGASYPLALAKPSVDSFLRNGSSGVPDYVAMDNIPGLLNAYNTVDYGQGGQAITGSSWADITGATFNLTTTRTCKIYIDADVTGYCTGTGYAFMVRAVVNGVADAQANQIFNGSAVRNEAMHYHYMHTSEPAGTFAVKLQAKGVGGGQTIYLERTRHTALAFVN